VAITKNDISEQIVDCVLWLDDAIGDKEGDRHGHILRTFLDLLLEARDIHAELIDWVDGFMTVAMIAAQKDERQTA